eukprot:1311074-Pleurochrysis_carterae.AAC.1
MTALQDQAPGQRLPSIHGQAPQDTSSWEECKDARVAKEDRDSMTLSKHEKIFLVSLFLKHSPSCTASRTPGSTSPNTKSGANGSLHVFPERLPCWEAPRHFLVQFVVKIGLGVMSCRSFLSLIDTTIPADTCITQFCARYVSRVLRSFSFPVFFTHHPGYDLLTTPPFILPVCGIVQTSRQFFTGEKAKLQNVKRTGKSYTVAQYVNYFRVPNERSGCSWTTKMGLPSNRHCSHDSYML